MPESNQNRRHSFGLEFNIMETDIETIYLEDVCRICMSVKETENRHNIFEQVLGESMLGGIYEDSSEDLREAFDSDLRLSDAMQWIFSIGVSGRTRVHI